MSDYDEYDDEYVSDFEGSFSDDEEKIDFDSKVTQSSLTTFTNTMLNN